MFGGQRYEHKGRIGQLAKELRGKLHLLAEREGMHCVFPLCYTEPEDRIRLMKRGDNPSLYTGDNGLRPSSLALRRTGFEPSFFAKEKAQIFI